VLFVWKVGKFLVRGKLKGNHLLFLRKVKETAFSKGMSGNFIFLRESQGNFIFLRESQGKLR